LIDVVAAHVHICRSDFYDLRYQLNAEMYITGLQRTLRLTQELLSGSAVCITPSVEQNIFVIHSDHTCTGTLCM